MPDYKAAVAEGFDLFVERVLTPNNIDVTEPVRVELARSQEMAVHALYEFEGKVGRPLDDSGVGMLAEWVAAATVIRSLHGEASLLQQDIDEFLPAAAKFLNTLFCPPPT